MKALKFIPILLMALALFSCEKGKNIEKNVKQTGWKAPIAADYEYNMTYITKVSFKKDVINKNTNTEVAAFCGNECRGWCKLDGDGGAYLAIYSNSFSGEAIEIRVYDSEKKRIYSNCNTFVFESNGSAGSINEVIRCY
ncbi:MAG: hypothetical protein LBQ31_05395 [Bacteroidales bacterium]|jgi:hypothetical protein|nr:hypothetical protein [Bacteroidales bacterium]